jgi:glycosyltransferase involved in cell wall biosynthesis
MKRKKRIVATTQCLSCGSWVCIARILNSLADRGYEVTVVSLGEKPTDPGRFKYISIPFLRYDRFGNITCYHPLLSLLWIFPLFVVGMLVSLIQRPVGLVVNGVTTGFSMAPFARLLGIKTLVMDHTTLKSTGGRMLAILKKLGTYVDYVVANSTGSYHDISAVVDSSKVIVNDHYADSMFFEDFKKDVSRKGPLVISYVGRIDWDKLCFPFLDAIEVFGNRKDVSFRLAGTGSDIGKAIKLAETYDNVEWLGFLKGRDEVKQIFTDSDVVWSGGDVTYLTLPAVEALACGAPIVIPEYAIVVPNNRKIDTNLVPKEIGWLVDTMDNKAVEKLLLWLIENKEVPRGMRLTCHNYAKKHYSSTNLISTIDALEKVMLDK